MAEKRVRTTGINYFIDEAHLIFNEASKALLKQIETMVKLIRSKELQFTFNPKPNGYFNWC
jgi:hypothetical protein